jgi:hypothetical protein
MGMFDYLRCHYPLPDCEGVDDPSTLSFQTKSLDSLLDTIVITQTGQLLHNDEIWDMAEDSCIHHQVLAEGVPLDFSGVLRFSGNVPATMGHGMEGAEFAALVESGQVRALLRFKTGYPSEEEARLQLEALMSIKEAEEMHQSLPEATTPVLLPSRL